MSYHIEYTGVFDAEKEPQILHERGNAGESLSAAKEIAEQHIRNHNFSMATIFDDPSNSLATGSGAPVAVFVRGGQWSGAWLVLDMDPAAWWSALTPSTQDALKHDPHGHVAPEHWREISEAGGAVLGAWWPSTEDGPAGLSLPVNLADYVEEQTNH